MRFLGCTFFGRWLEKSTSIPYIGDETSLTALVGETFKIPNDQVYRSVAQSLLLYTIGFAKHTPRWAPEKSVRSLELHGGQYK